MSTTTIPKPTDGPSLATRFAAVILTVIARVRNWADDTGRRLVRRLGDERGQATTEYALVLLAAALVALLVVAWATAGGGGARISRLFNRVVDSVIDRV